MKRLTDYIWRCACGTTYEEVRGNGQAEEIYNGLMNCWQDHCPMCGCPVTAGGELELIPVYCYDDEQEED